MKKRTCKSCGHGAAGVKKKNKGCLCKTHKLTAAQKRLLQFQHLPTCLNEVFQYLNTRQKKMLIGLLNKNQLLFLLDCVGNLQHLVLPINERQRAALAPYKNQIKNLTNTEFSIKRRLAFLQPTSYDKHSQRGGFIVPLLINILASALPLVLDKFSQH